MKYDEAMEYISSLSKYGIVPGLDSIKELCRRLGNPQDELKFIHIAGTNGKGSTLAYLSTVLRKAGYKVGKYVSPAIRCYEERIQVNEKMITKKSLCEEMEHMRDICDEMVRDGFHHPTPFEVETAMAFDYFLKKGCDVVVLETGMGGRMDATNIIKTTLVSVIASISMDHMQFLGDTLEKIAREKAGIIKEGSKVVVLSQKPEVMKAVREEAEKNRAEYIVADPTLSKGLKYNINGVKFSYKEYEKIELSLAGKVQVDNGVLALEVIRTLNEGMLKIPEKAVREGLKETLWQGRFSVIGNKPLFVIDGAHNEDAAKKLADSIEMYFTNKKIIYIMGILRDKEYEKIIDLTAKYAQQIITVATPNNKRAMDSIELAEEVMKKNPHVTAAASIEEAVEMAYLFAAKEDVILSFGSLSFLGKVMDEVEKRNTTGKKKK